jgi:hypothetical protein
LFKQIVRFGSLSVKISATIHPPDFEFSKRKLKTFFVPRFPAEVVAAIDPDLRDADCEGGPIKNIKLRHVLLSAVVCSLTAILLATHVWAASLPVPVSNSLEVIATNGDGNAEHNISREGRVPLVLVKPNQAVPITLQFPADRAGMPVSATPLDGGEVDGGHLVVLPTGKVILVFKPGAGPGRYRLEVRTPLERHLLEFYVVDPSNPVRRSGARRH